VWLTAYAEALRRAALGVNPLSGFGTGQTLEAISAA